MSRVWQRVCVCLLTLGFGSCSQGTEDSPRGKVPGEDGDSERRFSSDLERNKGTIADGFRLDTGLARRVTGYLAGRQLYFVVSIPSFDADQPETGVSLALCTDGRFALWEEKSTDSESSQNLHPLRSLSSGTWLVATNGPTIRLVLTPQKGADFHYELTEDEGRIFLDNEPVRIESPRDCE